MVLFREATGDYWSRNWKRRFFKRPEIGFEAREDLKLMAVMVANAKMFFLHSFTFAQKDVINEKPGEKAQT